MTNRSRGDYHERRVRDQLMERGFYVVRAAGSLGPADLVALRHDRKPRLIACKITGSITYDELNGLWTSAVLAGATPLIASRTKPGVIGWQMLLQSPRKGNRAGTLTEILDWIDEP